ncbi:hypothetical protein P879_01898 [Paragonimus westermani]|uniref:Uncharacterized protein n=1 Tax=Paragonimus westermani TaxID=34504 RepID=A0A8T0DL74_9TREM|nr:hypothetical protein P879_01898 [Paragonimus westermani]
MEMCDIGSVGVSHTGALTSTDTETARWELPQLPTTASDMPTWTTSGRSHHTEMSLMLSRALTVLFAGRKSFCRQNHQRYPLPAVLLGSGFYVPVVHLRFHPNAAHDLNRPYFHN